jgi:methyl-accepting chemotaxis protein
VINSRKNGNSVCRISGAKLMKISQQLRSAAVGILIVGIGSLVSVYLNSQGNDSKVVNYAGIVRGGTQRLIKLELAGKPSDKLIANQDKLVDGLINGDRDAGLPVATDPGFRNEMDKVATAWQDLKQKIVAVRQDSQTKGDLLAASEKYFDLANQAVFAAEKYSTIKSQQLQTIQIAVFATSLLLLIAVWMTIDKITNILGTSTTDITSSCHQISSIISQQEKSSKRQGLTLTQTTHVISGLKELIQQSTATTEMSVDRVTKVLELLKKVTAVTQENFTGTSQIREKINTISTDIDLLNQQIVKIAKVVGSPSPVLTTAGISLANTNKTANRHNNDIEQINKMFDNLQSSIGAMILTANDSKAIIDGGAKSTRESVAQLSQIMTTIEYLSLNSQQNFTTSKQYLNKMQEVSTFVNQLNVDAQETSTSISLIGVSAQELGAKTRELQTKI